MSIPPIRPEGYNPPISEDSKEKLGLELELEDILETSLPSSSNYLTPQDIALSSHKKTIIIDFRKLLRENPDKLKELENSTKILNTCYKATILYEFYNTKNVKIFLKNHSISREDLYNYCKDYIENGKESLVNREMGVFFSKATDKVIIN